MKVALVTGAGKQRVGWHVAQALAERGYALAIHYRTSAADAEQNVAELRAKNIDALALGADLSQPAEVRRMLDNILERWGQIDVLVNSAAIWQPKPLEEVTAADVLAHFEANVLGTFLCAQQAGLVMTRQAGGGVIVNLGDWAEARPYVDYAAYFASKGAIPTLTRSLAVELATRNPRVRVNCILPGPVLFSPDTPEAQRAEAIRGTLLKRAGSPRHVALAVLHFIDNDFITGACLPVDGGRGIYAANEPGSI